MRIFIFLIIFLLYQSCQNIIDLSYPGYGDESQLIGSLPMNQDYQSNLNGVYTVIEGNNILGDLCVIKSNKSSLSMYCGKSINFFIFETGIVNNNIVLEGYYRALPNQVTGLSRFVIDYNEGAKEILSGLQSDKITMRGIFNVGNNKKSFVISFKEKLKPDSTFYIIAHRGGGRNSDKLPASENSLEMIELAESLGANAIEIDVRITKDNVPVLFHDDFISSRLVNGDFLTGPIENYNYSHLKKLCKLKHGEELPSLEETLDLVINKTGIRLVWLDIKSFNSLKYIIPIIEANKLKAVAVNRNIDIVVGITNETIKNEFIDNNYFNNVNSLCEISVDDVRKTKSEYWGASWTLGTQLNEVRQMHYEGVKVFVWTIDDVKFMKSYYAEGEFDGIVTNYPSILAFEFYTK
ncbi:MAG: hypothetical protein A2X61_03075 [Ignavibacteria bacterium GWB2_35_12]|nr:MAG: hypothetical protein A2X63_11470 [Ignavibacteria bacterium GWA2_35_8]OGU38274.1 MAG: hypothetical protein A2X61_03075 [Ignavibacteria bacterium GWB2_35_12]OGU95495.1 MAG: hypothetical protein A2220_07250 [Ignavibacteria bacterium RIFOXYA2_FULL_35_10]OGV20788.1 MAG: hypothetical protein A2475_11470 [Ignavibacteria bacterium RIFOXYC2_FULL_35_21]